MVKSESLAPEALVAALRAGQNYSSQGPDIHAIDVTETEVVVACSPASTVMLLGRGTAGKAVFGTDMVSASLPLDIIKAGGYGRVVVVDARGKRAWSNPFWLD